jgi:branched-chain amino acid transport system ATP-binding protein
LALEDGVSALLRIENVGIFFGGVQALFGVTLDVHRGEIFAVIGPNGAGKTTLFNVISGLYPAQQGRVVLDGRDITGLPPHRLARLGLSRTFQNLQVFFRMSAVRTSWWAGTCTNNETCSHICWHCRR